MFRLRQRLSRGCLSGALALAWVLQSGCGVIHCTKMATASHEDVAEHCHGDAHHDSDHGTPSATKACCRIQPAQAAPITSLEVPIAPVLIFASLEIAEPLARFESVGAQTIARDGEPPPGLLVPLRV